ncbi:MAG: serine hydrolase domain-containing protein [Acidobacteriota bacterium]
MRAIRLDLLGFLGLFLLVAPMAFSESPVAVASPAVRSAIVDSTAIAQLVARYHAEDRFSGSVLVAAGDEVIYEGGFGEADRAWHIPNRPDTVFLVGSVSKQFTSMLIMQLVAEGKLRVEDTLAKHLPSYPADKAGITIHQLLSHSSGLPHYGGFDAIGIDLDDYLRLDRPVSDYVETIGRLELQSEPGSEYSYSSMGYIILAYIAEQVSGKSYGALIRERIARPIGVDDLGFAYNHEPVERLAHGYEFQIRRLDDGRLDLRYEPEPYRDQSNKYSTGGVHASVRALFKWARAVVGSELLDPGLRDRMFTPHAGTYGYGWRIDSGEALGLPEIELIAHGGSLAGYRASIVLVDRGRYTLVALGNSDSSRSGALTAAIGRLLFGLEQPPANILGTSVAWRMVRDGVDVGRQWFERHKEAGFPGYLNNDFAFYAYAERFWELERPDLGLALTELGQQAHPESPMLHLAAAESHRVAGNPKAALAAAEAALQGIADGVETPGFVAEDAQRLIDELQVELAPAAAAP